MALIVGDAGRPESSKSVVNYNTLASSAFKSGYALSTFGSLDAQNCSPVLIREMAVVTVTGIWPFGCSELQSRAGSDAQNSSLVLFREMAVVTVTGTWPLGC